MNWFVSFVYEFRFCFEFMKKVKITCGTDANKPVVKQNRQTNADIETRPNR